ncbi:hypothetical protein ASE00_17860 [Sphingomonas sp. Root710]|nr:hypothetical protein ASE00_17860 [Sphingomonas sp. Root710]
MPSAVAFAAFTLPYAGRMSTGELAFIILLLPVYIAIIGAAQIVMLIFIRNSLPGRSRTVLLMISIAVTVGEITLFANIDRSGNSTAALAIAILPLYLATATALGGTVIRWLAKYRSRRPEE